VEDRLFQGRVRSHKHWGFSPRGRPFAVPISQSRNNFYAVQRIPRSPQPESRSPNLHRLVTLVTFNEAPHFAHNDSQDFSGDEALLYQRFLRVAIFVLITASLASARDLALVANKSNAMGAITVVDLVKVCKAQTSRWPNGKSVTFVLRSPSAPEMKVVLEKVYGMSQSEVSGLIVSSNQGHPSHPPFVIVTSDEELVNTVASIPGAVGFVDVYSINSSVSVVKVAGKLPLEPGYLLHGN
jgi:hypothetical protein